MLLEKLGLAKDAKRKVEKYSGGMKRRLSLIMALIHDPQIVFLDEPTVGMDPQSRRAVWDFMKDLKRWKNSLSNNSLHGGGGSPLRPSRHNRPRQTHNA